MDYLLYRLQDNKSFHTYSHNDNVVTQKDVDNLKKNILLWNSDKYRVIVVCLEDGKTVTLTSDKFTKEDTDIIMKNNWKIKRGV